VEYYENMKTSSILNYYYKIPQNKTKEIELLGTNNWHTDEKSYFFSYDRIYNEYDHDEIWKVLNSIIPENCNIFLGGLLSDLRLRDSDA